MYFPPLLCGALTRLWPCHDINIINQFSALCMKLTRINKSKTGTLQTIRALRHDHNEQTVKNIIKNYGSQ